MSEVTDVDAPVDDEDDDTVDYPDPEDLAVDDVSPEDDGDDQVVATTIGATA